MASGCRWVMSRTTQVYGVSPVLPHGIWPSRAAAASDLAALAFAAVIWGRVLSGQRGQGLDCFDEACQASGCGQGGCGDGLLAGVDQAVREVSAERAWLEGCCQFTGEEHQGQAEFGSAQVVIWFGGDDVADGGGHGCQAGAMLGHHGWPGRGVLPFERGGQGDRSGSPNRSG